MKKMVMAAACCMALSAAQLVFAGGSKDNAVQAAPEGTAAGGSAAMSGTYTFGGSTTVQPIANGVIEALTRDNPELRISYEGLGSGTGLNQLAAGTLSLAGSSRELKASELAEGLIPVVIAKDGIAIVVNKDVAVANLSMQQVAAIFSGTYTNWSEVGGADEAIYLINRDEASGTYSSFQEIVLDPLSAEFSRNAIVAKENGEVAAKVASTPGAIGYVGLGFIGEITKAGGRALMIDGIEPAEETVLDGTYPISRNLYAVTKGDAAEGSVEKAFIDYALSARGSVIVSDAGFVPVQ